MTKVRSLLAGALAMLLAILPLTGVADVIDLTEDDIIDLTDVDIITIPDARFAYIGDGGILCVYASDTGEDNVYTRITKAEEYICEDEENVYFVAANANGVRSLMCADKLYDTAVKTLFTPVTHDHVYDPVNKAIWFMSAQEAGMLMKYDLPRGTVSQVARLPEGVTVELVAGLTGLYMEITNQTGATRMYSFDIDAFKLRQVSLPAEGGVYRAFGNCETLSTKDALYVRAANSGSFYRVEGTQPLGVDEAGGIVYYAVQDEDGTFRVKSWDPERVRIATLFEAAVPRVLLDIVDVVNGEVCLIDARGRLYCVSIAERTAKYKDLSKFPLYYVSVRTVGDRLAVYASETTTASPAFYALTAVNGDWADGFYELKPKGTPEPYVTPVPTPRPTTRPTPTPRPTVDPRVQYRELRLNDRGDDVREMQARLNALGYKCGNADGIMGRKTVEMVRYFCCDAGFRDTGTATPEMQAYLFSDNAPAYVQYRTLRKGDTGIRVEALQTRLRELGYTCQRVDGSYGDQTFKAVKVFQDVEGLQVDGVAGSRTLTALFKSSQKYYNGYITLRSGDEGKKVQQLRQELKSQGYISKVTSSYDNDTVKAVKKFQKDARLTVDGVAGAATQQALYDRGRPVPAPTPTPKPTAKPTEKPTPEPEPTPKYPDTKEGNKALVKTLNAHYGAGAFDEDTAPAWLEKALRDLGGVFGKQNGYTDLMTRMLALWQQDHNIKPTGGRYGLMNEDTLNAILKELGRE